MSLCSAYLLITIGHILLDSWFNTTRPGEDTLLDCDGFKGEFPTQNSQEAIFSSQMMQSNILVLTPSV